MLRETKKSLNRECMPYFDTINYLNLNENNMSTTNKLDLCLDIMRNDYDFSNLKISEVVDAIVIGSRYSGYRYQRLNKMDIMFNILEDIDGGKKSDLNIYLRQIDQYTPNRKTRLESNEYVSDDILVKIKNSTRYHLVKDMIVEDVISKLFCVLELRYLLFFIYKIKNIIADNKDYD